MFRRIDTVIVRVRDLQHARDWYQRTLRLHTTFEDPAERLAVLATPEGSSLTLWELKDGESLPAPTAAGTYPIFAVDDAVEARRLLLDQGADPEPVSDGDGVRFFGFRDPDGNRMEACQVLE